MNQYTETPTAPTTPAHFPAPTSPRRSLKLATAAPWIESGFYQLDRAFVAVASQLSATAVRAYLVHLSNAQASGERPNCSNQYRENAAAKMGRDATTLDKGNAELFKRGMLTKSARLNQRGAREWHLTAPSKWLFDSLKNASPSKKKRVNGDAKTRDIAKETKKESFKTNSARADFVVAALSIPSNVSDPETATTASGITDAERTLIEIGVQPAAAAALADQFAAPDIFQQIAWLPARNAKTPAALLIQAIRGGWDAPKSARDSVGTVTHQSRSKTPESFQNGGSLAAWPPRESSDEITSSDATQKASESPENGTFRAHINATPEAEKIAADEITAGFLLADEEFAAAAASDVFDALPLVERDRITAHVLSKLPDDLKRDRNSQGARISWRRGVKKEVELTHGAALRAQALKMDGDRSH